MITSEEISEIITNIINNNYKITANDISKIIDFKNQQEKVNELFELYHKLLKYIGLYNASTYCTKETLNDLEQKVKATQKQIDELENKINEMVGIEE